MNGKSKAILAILIFLIGAIVIFKDIADLFNKKAIREVNAGAAYEVLMVTHELYGLIPIKKDHYYLVLSEEDGQLCGYVVRGSEKWYRKNFSRNFLAVSQDGVEVRAIVKELRSKYEHSIHDKIQEIKNLYEGTGITIQMRLREDQFLDEGYIWRALFKLVTLLLIIGDVIAGVIVVRRFNRPDSLILKAYAIVLFVTLFLFIATIYISF